MTPKKIKPVKAWAVATENGTITNIFFCRKRWIYLFGKEQYVRVEIRPIWPKRRPRKKP